MALPTIANVWAHNKENQLVASQGSALATARRAFRTAIKDAIVGLTGTPFSVRYSCNSVAAGTPGDGVDRWATDADLVWANAGVAHSWIVLRSLQGWELLLSLEASSVQGATIIALLSHTGFTGGSTTARPTATDEINCQPNVNGGLGADAAYRIHVLGTSSGNAVHIIICTGGTINGHWWFMRPDQPTVANVLVGGIMTTSPLLTISLMGGTPMRARVNGITSQVRLTTEGAGTLGPIVELTSAVSDITNDWIMTPCGLYSATASAQGPVGRAQDIWWCSAPAALGSGTNFPADATRAYAKFGNAVIPWGGTAALLA